MKRILERDIEKHLVKRVKDLGGVVRKVAWVGRRSAPDRVALLPVHGPLFINQDNTIWVEVKNPETIKTFPANAHERAQSREHARMRKLGQRVEVVGTYQQVEELLT